MAKVRTFYLDKDNGLPDKEVASFITECEADFYVNVSAVFVPYPTPRMTFIVTKLDVKLPEVA